MDERTVELMSEYCYCVFFGLEAGSERVRNDVIRKMLTDKQIKDAAVLLHKYSVPFGTYNMFGVPSETLGEVWKTVELNKEIKTTYPYGGVFHPFPGTKIIEDAMVTGYIPSDFSLDYKFNPIKFDTPEEKDRIKNVSDLFYFLVKYNWFYKLGRVLVKFPPNKLFEFIARVGAFSARRNTFNVGLWKTFKIGWQLRKDI